MRAMGAMRDRVEGLLCGIVCPTSDEARRSQLRRRGLRPIRETWWTPLQYESAAALWRNVRLLETTPEPRAVAPDFPETARIVVQTPGHLGDILHAAPLLGALRSVRPRAHITWVVGSWSAALAGRYKAADRIEVFSPSWFQYRRGARGPGLREQIQWGRDRAGCDVFVSTANADLTTLFVGRAVRPTWWLGRPPAGDLYRVAGRQDLVPARRDVYEAEDLLALAAPLGIGGCSATLAYTVTDGETERGAALLARAGVARGAPYAVIAPGAGWPGKQWPLDRWANVADELHLMGLSVVLAGTAAETDLCRRVRAVMRSPCAVLAGQTSLDELAAVIAGARLWMGSDSGGLHLAAAVGTPTVSLFGPTSPAKWAPRGSRHRFLRAVGGCPGCVPWHPRAVCLQDGACMKKIPTDAVRSAVSDLLETIQQTEGARHEV